MATGSRALIVEDNPVDAIVLGRFIEGMPGWEVARAATLAEARLAVDAANPRYNLLLVDLTLPDAQGLEAVDFVQEAAPDAVCVVVTGEAHLSIALDALRNGASDYLVKGGLQEQAVQRSLQLAVLRRELGRQVEESEANLRAVLGAMQDSLFVVRDDGSIAYRNPPAELLEVRFRDFDSGFGAHLHAMPEAVEHVTVRTRRGESVPVEVRAGRVRWAGEEARLVVIRDVSAEQAMQRLIQRTQRVEELAKVGTDAYGDWHDIRNKLQVMDHAITRLTDGDDSTATGPLPVAVLRAVQRDLQGVADRYRRGAVDQRRFRAVLDLRSLVESKCRMFRAQLDPVADLALQLRPLPSVLGDEVEVGGVIENLLTNAKEAIAGLGRRGRVVVATFIDRGEAVVTVSDDGPGFPPGPLERWFQQGESSKTSGTGLGLWRVREAMQEHGGDVHVQSLPGFGATLTLRFPVARTADASAPRRVLIAEDDGPVGRALRRLLERHGHQVVLAANGLEALDAVSEEASFDAVICDLEMPEMDGPGFYQALAEVAPELQRRLVFCSGGASSPATVAFLRGVAAPRLMKPISPDDVLAMVEQLAGRR